jgi:hypothetical protein
VLATRHGKGEAIGPALAPLGLSVRVTDAVDTDALGTFTGTVPRAGTMREAALAKCRAALAIDRDADFAVASEGAFGPHPNAPFVTADVELVLLVSRDLAFEASAERVVTDVPAIARVARTVDEARAIAALAGFPAHALLVCDGDDPRTTAPPRAMLLRNPDAFDAAVHAALAAAHAAIVGNDLRAHANPSRMRVIGLAAADLAQALARECPRCHRPGVVITPQPGLPCGACGTPSSATGFDLATCAGCELATRTARHGTADPSNCPVCNP